jgi:hypothetical protein
VHASADLGQLLLKDGQIPARLGLVLRHPTLGLFPRLFLEGGASQAVQLADGGIDEGILPNGGPVRADPARRGPAAPVVPRASSSPIDHAMSARPAEEEPGEGMRRTAAGGTFAPAGVVLVDGLAPVLDCTPEGRGDDPEMGSRARELKGLRGRCSLPHGAALISAYTGR